MKLNGKLWAILLLGVTAFLSFDVKGGVSKQGFEEDFEKRKSTLNDNSCFDIFNSGSLQG